MYIACQSRDGDLDSFFKHENHAWPPSLAENNTMHQENKADLVDCLESLAERPKETPDAQVKLMVLHWFRPLIRNSQHLR